MDKLEAKLLKEIADLDSLPVGAYNIRKNGGAGLGLALCARIAEMHGAQLRIKSAPGQGTTVFLAFPETPPAEPEGGEST